MHSLIDVRSSGGCGCGRGHEYSASSATSTIIGATYLVSGTKACGDGSIFGTLSSIPSLGRNQISLLNFLSQEPVGSCSHPRERSCPCGSLSEILRDPKLARGRMRHRALNSYVSQSRVAPPATRPVAGCLQIFLFYYTPLSLATASGFASASWMVFSAKPPLGWLAV